MPSRTFAASASRAVGGQALTHRMPGNLAGQTWEVTLTVQSSGGRLRVVLEDSVDGGTTYRERGTWGAQIEGDNEPHRLSMRVENLGRDVRLSVTVDGSPVTFAVEGQTL